MANDGPPAQGEGDNTNFSIPSEEIPPPHNPVRFIS